MSLRVDIRPEMIRWARQRARLDVSDLLGSFPKLAEWESGALQPTLKQLEKFAAKVHVPLGYLFLPEPPNEPVPIPDFRTFANREVRKPSPELLDTIYLCQQRQEWYREHALLERLPSVPFIGSASIEDDPVDVAARIADAIGFSVQAREASSTWEDAFRQFREQAEEAGVLVMVSSYVGSNTRRTLDVEEFRGFALSDELAPVIFINGRDTKAGQMFTLAHELAHLWLGASGVSNMGMRRTRGFAREEVWCNRVAAELLVPMHALRAQLRDDAEPLDTLKQRLARHFKVSTLVILRRLLDARRLHRDAFERAWEDEVERLRGIMQRRNEGGGGNYYNALPVRVSRRFLQAVLVSAHEGHTLFRDAYQLLGIRKAKTFSKVTEEVLGIPALDDGGGAQA